MTNVTLTSPTRTATVIPMSITFHAARHNTAKGWVELACPGHAVVCPHLCEDYNHYHLCDHTEDAKYAAEDACPFCSHDVNLSNGNAALVLDRLGLDFDYCGTIDPDDLLGRALTANIGRDDSGMPGTVDHLPGHATVIDCGLDAGYFDRNMGRLADLATVAKAHGAIISWG